MATSMLGEDPTIFFRILVPVKITDNENSLMPISFIEIDLMIQMNQLVLTFIHSSRHIDYREND